MLRKILGVIISYAVMAAFVFLTFSILYALLGAENSFEPGSYKVSSTWLVLSIVLGFIAAIMGGYICMLISKNRKTALVLAGIVFVLGIIMAVPAMNYSEEELNQVREGDVSNTEAMQNAKQPVLALIINPIIGAAGLIAGSRLKKEKKTKS